MFSTDTVHPILFKRFPCVYIILFIHDYFARPQYHSIEKYYNIIGGVKDTQQTIVGLKKK